MEAPIVGHGETVARLAEAVEEVPQDLIGDEQAQECTTSGMRDDGEQRCAVRVATLMIKRAQCDGLERGRRDVERAGTPSPQFEDREGQAPGKPAPYRAAKGADLAPC